MKSAVDVSGSALYTYRLTIHIRSDDTIRPNTNTLFGPIFGTEANTKRIFGTSLVDYVSANAKELRNEYLVADAAQRKQMEQRYGRKNIQKLVEDAFNEQWLSENAKKCPQCRANIEV